MRIAVISVNLKFFGDIAAELYRHHTVRFYEETSDNGLNCYNIGRLCEWADVIWCEFAQPPFQLALNLAPEKKIIVRLHRIEVYNPFIYTLNWRAVDMLIFSAEHIKEFFYKKLGEAKAPEGGLNIENKPVADIVLPTNVVNHKIFKFKQREFKPPYNICMVGRIVEIKRIYDFIQWFRDLDDRFRLNIVAQEVTNWDSSYERTVKELAEQDSRISIIPELKGASEVAEFMQSQDIIVSHSREEGTHVAVMEAMATGCYPLISCWKGADVVYPAKYVYHSPKEFYDKIDAWLRLDPIQKLRASIDAYEFTKPYDSVDMAVKIRELIEAVYNRDNIADYYDSLVPHMIEQKDNARNRDTLRFIEQWITPDMKVLDLGCGIGVTTEHIRQLGADVIGLDLSPKAIEYARKHSKAKFRCGSIFFERFYDKFDCVVLADVLEHVKLDQHPELFKRLNELTTDNGMLIINIPHPDHMKQLRRAYPYGNMRLFQPVDETVEIEPLLERLKAAGFTEIKYSAPALNGLYYKIVVSKKGGEKESCLREESG